MRFLVSVIDDTTGSATQAEMAAIDTFNERLVAEGHWVVAGGLAPPGDAIVIDDRDGAASIVDGPLLQSDEYVSGFWIIEAPDPAVARDLALEASRSCNRRVELRPLLGG